jgi:single-strand DNA-binding protein
MNFGTFAGNIGRDAETKAVGQNTVTNFSVAVSTGWGDKKSTLWVGCALWGERGQKLEQYLTTGAKVTVSGDIDVRAYSAKDGTAKAEMTCNVQRVTLQGGGQGGGQRDTQARDNDPPQTIAQKSQGKAAGGGGGGGGEFDDEIPFSMAWVAPCAGLLLGLAYAGQVALA